MAIEKAYQNIYAYKPNVKLEYYIVLIIYLIFCVLFCFGLFLSIFFIISVIISSVIWGGALISLIKYKSMPDFIITQKDENLIIFPDTRNIVVSLKEIIAIKKKYVRGRYGQKSIYGKIIIIAKNKIYRLMINDLNLIFSRLENNLKIANS